MSNIAPKDLKRLADACRKAGIVHYKDADVEFTLGEVPPSNYKRKANGEAIRPDTDHSVDVANDSLTDDALLFWSTGGDGEDASQ